MRNGLILIKGLINIKNIIVIWLAKIGKMVVDKPLQQQFWKQKISILKIYQIKQLKKQPCLQDKTTDLTTSTNLP
jgi:hypothetical protein